jgi:hypothetical protein
LRLLGQQVVPELLVKSGEDFIRTCTVRMDSGLNVTCTLPSSGGSPTDTATHRQNEAALFLRKVIFQRKQSNMNHLIIKYQFNFFLNGS